MSSLKFSFLGGALEVGRSAILLDLEEDSILLDCGVKFEDLSAEPVKYPLTPAKIDSIMLSHAHLDHSGFIPGLYKQKTLPVYGTNLTLELSHILQRDNVKVCKQKRINIPYSDKDVDSLSKSEVHVEYDDERNILKNTKFTLYDAGHIPGSASILLEAADGRKIMYTGDINPADTRLLKGAKLPDKLDILIIEGTYGDRDHPDRKETENLFLKEVEETVEGGGVALVPVFSVGRSQEVIMLLDNCKYPVYFDGLCKEITKILLSEKEYIRDPRALESAANNARWVEHGGERKNICKEPCVIVSTSGMMHGGPVLDYLNNLRSNPRNSLLVTGYQVKGTNGRKILEEGFMLDEKTGRKVKVSMNARQFDFSAHADRSSLMRIVEKVSPEKVFVVHGDPPACESLSNTIRDERGIDVYTPQVGDQITL